MITRIRFLLGELFLAFSDWLYTLDQRCLTKCLKGVCVVLVSEPCFPSHPMTPGSTITIKIEYVHLIKCSWVGTFYKDYVSLSRNLVGLCHHTPLNLFKIKMVLLLFLSLFLGLRIWTNKSFWNSKWKIQNWILFESKVNWTIHFETFVFLRKIIILVSSLGISINKNHNLSLGSKSILVSSSFDVYVIWKVWIICDIIVTEKW